MIAQEEAQIAYTIFKLLRQATSQQVVKDFLKSHDVAISASNWDDLYTRRIEPALQEGKIAVADLRTLLREVEEYGRQHVFLFRCTPARAKALLATTRIQTIVSEVGLDNLLDTPLDLELPDAATIVDIRQIPANGVAPFKSLVIKQVETRSTRKFLREDFDSTGNTMSRTYSVERKRAVNIVRLYEDGLLELRIASQDNSTRYHDNVNSLFGSVSQIIPRHGFDEISLRQAKKRFFNERQELAEEVRYSHSSARNDFGFSMNVSCSSQDDNICNDGGSIAALQGFIDNEGQVVGTNIYLKIPDEADPREVHILISGEVNEFAIPVTCSANDYEYVRGKIFSLNV